MSEVESFWCHEASNIKCVRASDYDELRQQLADANHQRDMLAKSIGDAALKAGIVREGVGLTGPMLMMLADDLAECSKASEARNAEAIRLATLVQETLRSEFWDKWGGLNEARELLEIIIAQSAPATTLTYEVQWNSIHGPEGWKVVTREEYQRCQGPLWDRRTTNTAPATDEQVKP